MPQDLAGGAVGDGQPSPQVAHEHPHAARPDDALEGLAVAPAARTASWWLRAVRAIWGASATSSSTNAARHRALAGSGSPAPPRPGSGWWGVLSGTATPLRRRASGGGAPPRSRPRRPAPPAGVISVGLRHQARPHHRASRLAGRVAEPDRVEPVGGEQRGEPLGRRRRAEAVAVGDLVGVDLVHHVDRRRGPPGTSRRPARRSRRGRARAPRPPRRRAAPASGRDRRRPAARDRSRWSRPPVRLMAEHRRTRVARALTRWAQ